ncbi:MAG: hypothetical protein Q9168_005103 [Polycauliona sp. 1 TL-2023]
MPYYHHSVYHSVYPQTFYDPYIGAYFYDDGPVVFDEITYYLEDGSTARYADGSPIAPPMVCRGGCTDLNHRIPRGGLPQGTSLGICHQLAEDEGIHLTHVEGGCFKDGVCERLNAKIIKNTLRGLDYRRSDFDSGRQMVRVAAGLSPGPADEIPRVQDRLWPPVWWKRRTNRHERPSTREGPRQRHREPEPYYSEEDADEPRPSMRRRPEDRGYGAGSQGSREESTYPYEVEEPDDLVDRFQATNLNERPQGSREPASARNMTNSRHDSGMDRRSAMSDTRGMGGHGGSRPMEDRYAPSSSRGGGHGGMRTTTAGGYDNEERGMRRTEQRRAAGGQYAPSSSHGGAHGGMRSNGGGTGSSRHPGGPDLVPRGYDFDSQRSRR